MRERLERASVELCMPDDHVAFLKTLRDEHSFVSKVDYDIGCCVLHWTRAARGVWPGLECVVFDAFEPVQFLWEGHRSFCGVLSDRDDRVVRWYQHDTLFGGNSYYREVGGIFPPDTYLTRPTHALDSVVARLDFPPPDLIKIDVQGAELDILRGARQTLQSARYLIVELQHVQYNEGAPLAHETIAALEGMGWRCVAERFSDNGPDADYCFKNLAFET